MTKEVNGKKMAMPVECYSRVTGYYRRVEQWNPGKQEEFRQRTPTDPTKIASQMSNKFSNHYSGEV